MADMLSTGVSGLLASQIGLSTVSHNVANVNTDGYSRQVVSFGARLPEGQAGYYVGTGVNTVAVQRAYSEFLNSSLWSASSGQGRPRWQLLSWWARHLPGSRRRPRHGLPAPQRAARQRG